MTGKLKKLLLPNLPYLLFAWLFDKLCQAVRLAPGADASEKLLRIAQGFTEAFASLWLSLHPLDLLLGVAGATLVRLAVCLKAKNAKKYRRGVEYGSARWGRSEDIAPYIDPVPDWNIPLTRTESLTMTSRPKDPKTARNKNILVIGGSGSGKTMPQHLRVLLSLSAQVTTVSTLETVCSLPAETCHRQLCRREGLSHKEAAPKYKARLLRRVGLCI